MTHFSAAKRRFCGRAGWWGAGGVIAERLNLGSSRRLTLQKSLRFRAIAMQGNCSRLALIFEGKACLIRMLLLVQGSDAGEGFAFEEFEGGASAGGAVGDFVGDAEFFGGGGGVSSANDCDGT